MNIYEQIKVERLEVVAALLVSYVEVEDRASEWVMSSSSDAQTIAPEATS